MNINDKVIEMVANQIEKDSFDVPGDVTKDWLDEQLLGYADQLNLNKDSVDEIEAKVRQRIAITVGEASFLIDPEDQEEWLTEERIDATEWKFWTRYEDYFKTKGIPGNVLRRTHTDTNRILGLIGDPLSENSFRRRGMVIGDVQAGKTNNYTALINKAADVGYKLIIVLTGTVEDLRQQTQERLDEDFVGSISHAGSSGNNSPTRTIGVGRWVGADLPFCITDQNEDIRTNPRYRISGINGPILAVTKKNKFMLERLVNWLRSDVNSNERMVSEPVLLIDDEADNASVNTGEAEENPKTINRLIREVIHSCKKISYVAYTATPFANIFIHPDSEGDVAETDDLFPKDFLVALEPPNNYCGARFFFRNDARSKSICEVINDADQHLPLVHRPGTAVESIPESLKEAVRVFLLACAVKDLRRKKGVIKKAHDSMLINMSRLTSVQSDIAPHVEAYLDDIWSAIELYICKSTPQERSNKLSRLFGDWNKHYSELDGQESWSDVCQALADMKRPVVVTVHSRSGDSLTYKDGGPEKQIAVGGLKLSRGLTLEGLVVSYFYRRSVMYDSLMQMGRWYGYRDGYQDLLKLWITGESLDWYAHISEASDNLREQAAEMQKKKMTPSEFGLRVQASPDALMVTAPNKMRTARTMKTRMRFDDRLLQTDCVYSEQEIIDANLHVFLDFIDAVSEKAIDRMKLVDDHQHHLGFENISSAEIIECLSKLANHPSCGFWSENDLFLKFLKEGAVDEFPNWDVFVYQPKNNREGSWDGFGRGDYRKIMRSVHDEPKNPKNSNELRLSRRQNIVDPGVEALGLGSQEYMNALDENGKLPDKKARRFRKKPSLIFHIINACEFDDEGKRANETTVLGWAISIPPLKNPQPDVLWSVTIDWFEKYGTEITEEAES
ncbi:Z1 domain-containing protein [Halomonas sp. 1390]|uniref:Z1 domain-containing protein n=1 Tax=Halomonas sp. B23F22_3 TaxID=3459516 RepID=UPI00373E1A62